MTRLERELVKARLLKLIVMKSTGNPLEIARRLDISERSVKRFVRELREEGQDIRFCHSRKSYTAS